MARVLVVADDLTGANASAAGFARAGLRAVTIGQSGEWGAVAEFHPRFDVVVVTTDTRHAQPPEADRAVREAVRAGWPVDLVSCRIDTTLRGNVGPAAAATLDEVRSLSEHRVVGLCQPAHPQAGRVTVDGHQLLYGQRLEETELARDVRSPMTTSEVATILRQGTDLTVASLHLTTITGPRDGLVARVRELLEDPSLDVIVSDCITEEHFTKVAEAAVQADPDVRWVSIDPGPGSVAMAAALGVSSTGGGRPLLVVSGSATALTQQQLARLIADKDVVLVKPVERSDSNLPDIDATVHAVVDAVNGASVGQVVLLATVLDPSDLRDLTPEESDELPRALGTITRRVLQEVSVDGLYTTGGDITAAVLSELQGQGVEIEDEVIPLAVAGEIVAGPWAGLPIVTKGGLIGTAETALTCVDHLARSAQVRSRFVSSGVSREATGTQTR